MPAVYSHLRHPLLPYLLLALAATALTLWAWGDIALHPGEWLFGVSPDGIKNYYGPLYQVEYGSGFTFEGMWYPYGEHLLYLDAMPLVVWVAQGIAWLTGASLSPRLVGIINAMMLYAVVPGVWALYALLRRYRLPVWYSAVAVLPIAFLSPQYARLTAHYGLALLCVFPLQWLCLEWLLTTRRRVALAFVVAVTSLWLSAFLHAYLLVMGAMFYIGYVGVGLIYRHFYGSLSAQRLWAVAGAVVVALGAFGGFMALTDDAEGRHEAPYGFYAYEAQLENIVLPPYSPTLDVWKAFVRIKDFDGEGQGYIGLVGVVVALLLLVRMGRAFYTHYLQKQQPERALRPGQPFGRHRLNVALLTGLLIVLYSMGIPLQWLPESWVSKLGPLVQFRALGRLIWPFYYIFGVVTAYYAYLWHRSLRLRGATATAWLLLVIVMATWSVEAAVNQRKKYLDILPHREGASFYRESAEYVEKVAAAGYDVTDFQAILPLPYYTLGAEEFYLLRNYAALRHSTMLSYGSGLPITTGYSSRTPWLTARETAQLLAPPLLPKAALDHMDDRPLLLLVAEGDLTEYESNLIARADTLVASLQDFVKVYRLPIAALQAVDSTTLRRYTWMQATPERATAYTTTAAHETLPPLTAELAMPDTLAVHFWQLTQFERAGYSPTHISITDADGSTVHRATLDPTYPTHLAFYQDWIAVTHRVPLPAGQYTISLKPVHAGAVISRAVVEVRGGLE